MSDTPPLRINTPDILTCIANLSNDAVFTPPTLVNQMLNTLETAWARNNSGANIWEDAHVTFLDPFTKSGIFLREIVRRLLDGLEKEIPDLQSRVDHVLSQQVFGIATETLTSQLSRRSVYCSKWANGKHSITQVFDDPAGNIWFERVEHTWVSRKKVQRLNASTAITEMVEGIGTGRCKYCGASESEYGRSADLESHAYAFIHTDKIKARVAELFGGNMKFDVIIGNPPYQLSDGGGTGSSAAPIYQKFVQQAKALDPRYLVMVTPSRWFTGGKGLDEYRDEMLNDRQIRHIDDYLISADVFPQNGPKGGVCVFLWEKGSSGTCEVVTHFKGEALRTQRPLLEEGADVFIRFNEGVSVLQKVSRIEGSKPDSVELRPDLRFDALVSTRRPFGFSSTFRGRPEGSPADLRLLQRGGNAFVSRSEISQGHQFIDAWKIFVGFAAPGTGDKDTYPHRIISTPFVGEPGTVCTETYLCIGPFSTKKEAENALSYLTSKFVRFLILLHKPSQNTTRRVYTFVPTQDWSRRWTDAELYERYGLDDTEISFIEDIVRPMEIPA